MMVMGIASKRRVAVDKGARKKKGEGAGGAAAALSMVCRIRAFDVACDVAGVEELETRCEAAAGASGLSLFADLLGDPLSRVRSYPAYHMLVAEAHEVHDLHAGAGNNGDGSAGTHHDENENGSGPAISFCSISSTSTSCRIVGIVRAGIKEVMRSAFLNHRIISAKCHVLTEENYVKAAVLPKESSYMKVACISGLRVSRHYRRMGIGQHLVEKMEAWCKERGAEVAYMATQSDNEASIRLFTHKLSYARYRAPAILVQPVYAKPMRVLAQHQQNGPAIEIHKLPTQAAELIYRTAFGGHDFFPRDIHALLRSPLNAGTWIACYTTPQPRSAQPTVTPPPASPWAVLSLWKLNEIIKFEMRGASPKIKGYSAISRILDKLIPWLTVPSLPNMFDGPFGVQLVYGMHATPAKISSTDGKTSFDARPLLESLCWHAHNLALKDGCQVVLAEMDASDPLKGSVPHWASLSEQDLWCVKPLVQHISHDMLDVANHSSLSPPSFFLDPRDF